MRKHWRAVTTLLALGMIAVGASFLFCPAAAALVIGALLWIDLTIEGLRQ